VLCLLLLFLLLLLLLLLLLPLLANSLHSLQLADSLQLRQQQVW
jgi:hypothetical protein